MIAVGFFSSFTRAELWVLAGVALVLSIVASAHAVLYKRDPRSALLWLGLAWLVPLGGPLLYFMLGINRIRRRALRLRGEPDRLPPITSPPLDSGPALELELPTAQGHLAELAKLVDKVVSRPLLGGNTVHPLINGDGAFPAMLAAIARARHSIALCTYIFDRDEVGMEFVQALGEAVRRGVDVRVLVDATGALYSWPSILGALRQAGIPHARFLPAIHLVSLNLRNHRKLLVVDGRLGFTGGMNLRVGHCLARKPKAPVQDLQFQIEGPVVAHLQEAFAVDWRFSASENLTGERWFPALESRGPVVARGIADGPDEDFETLRWTLLGALSLARKSVRILTPYFLPDAALISALNLAAMRGVVVDILLPATNNLPFMHWASRALWWQVLERGCRLALTPPPFDHSKLMIVDDAWVLIGSTNWDPRSLRLNFEFNVECYGPALAQELAAWFEARRTTARPVSLAEVDARALPARLRDSLARLVTPFL